MAHIVVIIRAAEKKPLGIISARAMEIGERVLAATFEKRLPHLDERRRLVLGAEAPNPGLR